MAEVLNSHFLSLTFEGGRFKDHMAPVEVLGELATMAQLLFEVARDSYREAHPETTRLPRGFREACRLLLRSTSDNCFTAKLVMKQEALTSPPIVAALRTITDVLDAANREDGEIPLDRLSAPAINRLVSLGRRLAEDETLCFGQPGGQPAYLNAKTRRRIAKRANRKLELETGFEGEVIRCDDQARNATVRAAGQPDILVKFDSVHRDAMIEALQGRPSQRVRIYGLAEIGTRSIEIKLLDDIEFFQHDRADEIQRMRQRLRDLQGIPEGWDGEAGAPPSDQAVMQARDVLSRLLVERPNVPKPGLYPTEQGGIRAEWIIGNWHSELEFTGKDEPGTFWAVQAHTGEDVTQNVSPTAESVEGLGALFDQLGA